MKAFKLIPAILVVLVALTFLPSGHAVSVNNFTLDKSSYNPGESGKATITVYNDQQSLIRITGVDVNFNYFYSDGRIYTQDFITPAMGLNVSTATTSQPVTVQFNLPSGISVGYFTPSIHVTYQVLGQTGFGNDRGLDSNASTPLQVSAASAVAGAQTMMYLFVVATVLFAGIACYFAVKYWSTKGPTTRSKTD